MLLCKLKIVIFSFILCVFNVDSEFGTRFMRSFLVYKLYRGKLRTIIPEIHYLILDIHSNNVIFNVVQVQNEAKHI